MQDHPPDTVSFEEHLGYRELHRARNLRPLDHARPVRIRSAALFTPCITLFRAVPKVPLELTPHAYPHASKLTLVEHTQTIHAHQFGAARRTVWAWRWILLGVGHDLRAKNDWGW